MTGWFMQLVDHSAFAQPNEIRSEINEWLAEQAIEHAVAWADDSPYPVSITLCDVAVLPDYEELFYVIQQQLGETEYMVFAWLANGEFFQDQMRLYIVTKTLIATLSGVGMVHELVRQLHTAAAPAVGNVSEENS